MKKLTKKLSSLNYFMIFYIVFIVFLLFAVRCIYAPDSASKSTHFEINGVMMDVGNYTRIEQDFLNQLKANGITNYVIYDSGEITADILKNRKGITVIERCIGIVTDIKNGDGIILNACDEANYISYRGCQESCGLTLLNGTVLISYMIYDPGNNCIDDIMERYDFVLCREYEERVLEE